MVIRSNSNSDSASASATTSFANLTNPTNLAVNTVTATVTAFLLIPDLVAVLLSLILLTGAVLYSLNLESSAYLLLIYISYFPSSSNKTILVFLTYPAILRILYRPIEKQVRL